MQDEAWRARIDADNKKCNEARIRLEEHEKSQQKEINENKELISELYDYKNNIYRKLTVLEVDKVDVKDHNSLAKCVTQLKTEKKFLPYVIMILSLIGTIISVVYMTNKFARGVDIGKSRSQVEVNERLPILRSEVPKDNQ
jgi:GTPase involved in cell partitioning and DNA repair